jgi:hypothetical protein
MRAEFQTFNFPNFDARLTQPRTAPGGAPAPIGRPGLVLEGGRALGLAAAASTRRRPVKVANSAVLRLLLQLAMSGGYPLRQAMDE